jgi:hypothetical protein
MTATLTTTVNAVETAVGKLKLNGAANGYANGHANGKAMNGHVNGENKKVQPQLVDPFNYVVSSSHLYGGLTDAQGETFGQIDESYPYADLLRESA